MQKRHTHLTHRTMFALAALVIAPLSVETGYGQEDLLSQEMIRRQQDVAKADELLNEGREAYSNGEFEIAVQKYREALNTLPFGTATSDRRAFVTKSLEEGSVTLTQQYRQQGKFEEARDLLEEIDKNDPGNRAAKKGLEYLDDPTRTEAGLTFEHTENVDQVRRFLYKGETLIAVDRNDDRDWHPFFHPLRLCVKGLTKFHDIDAALP